MRPRSERERTRSARTMTAAAQAAAIDRAKDGAPTILKPLRGWGSLQEWRSYEIAARMPLLVRLKAYLVSEVQVHTGQNAFQPVTDCNRVAGRRGGEQQEVNVRSAG